MTTRNAKAALKDFPETGQISFDEIVRVSATGIAVTDGEGRLSFANPALQRLLGLEDPAGGKVGVGDLIHETDDSAALRHFARVFRGETSLYKGEHRFRHRDGRPVWVLAVLSAHRPGKGHRHFNLQLTDIELQKQSEAALVHSESRWNFALEGARQGVWDHDGQTDTMFYSRMWKTMRGIPPDEVVDDSLENWLGRIHPDDRERIRATVKAQDQGVDGYDTLEYRERHREGHYIWILSRGKPVEWDQSGRSIRTIGTDTDITHLKRIEAELAAEKERWRVTLESVADGMLATDAASRVVFMNPAANGLTGWRSADAIGRPIEEVFAIRNPATGEPLPSPVRACFEASAPTMDDVDIVLASRTGGECDIRCSAAPVRMPNGATLGAVVVFQDITQSRAMQKQLAHSANHDVLTGLPNRAAFDRALNLSVAAARGSAQEACLLYLDLDHFKPVNDGAGHAAGDELLRQVASTIRGSCRNHDFVARIGGDEFAILLHGCDLRAGRRAAEKICEAIAALDFTWAEKRYRVRASIGVTVIGAAPASSLGHLGEADAACYAAKAAGRSQAMTYAELTTSR